MCTELHFASLQPKKKTELSIPIQSGTVTKPRSQSQGSPISERSSVSGNERRATLDNRISETKFSYLYPYDEMFSRKSSGLLKSKSNSEIALDSKEINNNKMGGGFAKQRPRAAPPPVPAKDNINAHKSRTTSNGDVSNEDRTKDERNNNNRPDLLSSVESKLKSAQSFSDNIHTTTDSLWKTNKNHAKHPGNKSENWDSQARRKHDSGFYSDITMPNDKVQYSTFRSELGANELYLSDKNMAGSSTPLNPGIRFGMVHLEKQALSDSKVSVLKEASNSNTNGPDPVDRIRVRTTSSDAIHTKHVNDSLHGVQIDNKCVRNPHTSQRTHPYSGHSGVHPVNSSKMERQISPKTQCVRTAHVNSAHAHHGVSSHVRHTPHNDASHVISAGEHTSNSGHRNKNLEHHSPNSGTSGCMHKHKNVERNSSGGSGSSSSCSKRHSFSPKQSVIVERSQIHKVHSPKEYSQSQVQQQWADVSHLKTRTAVESGINNNASKVRNEVKESIENEDPVSRAQSLGDLTAGCTFSLVGQKKSGSVQALTETEFTGSQLAKHFRKYREMKPELIHGSLPGRMKCVGNETKARPKLENMNIQPESQLQVYSSGMGGRCKKQQHYGSLQHLPMSEMKDNHRDLPSVRNREKTPIKPRRALPQVPGDVDEKKRQYSDMVKLQLATRNSNSPSSRNSNRPPSRDLENRPVSSEGRTRSRSVEQGGISATPSFSDREVSELLEGSARDHLWGQPSNNAKCNKISHPKSEIIPPDAVYDNDKLSLSYPLYSTGTFVSHEHSNTQSGSRHSESGQNTITSQSTVDSGYITNDPEMENNTTLSTSSYAKSLKESSNKLFKSPKGEQPNVIKQHRDHDTRNWIEKHPGTFLKELKPNVKSPDKDKLDRDIEMYAKVGSRVASDKENFNPKLADVSYMSPRKPLTHRSSEVSLKEAEKFNPERKYFKPKVKAVSMSYGLNLIESNNGQNNSGLLKSQPKFTGSLMNLTHTETQGLTSAPSLDSLKNEVKNSTLPGCWKFGGNRTESSLKLLGKPSLFQLLQNYSVYPVRLKIPEKFSLLDNVRLLECEVVLPSPWSKKDAGTVTSPKGSYAKLGGPNSAFKPVVSGSSSIGSVSMVTIVDISNQINDLYELGQIQKGDLIVEVG